MNLTLTILLAVLLDQCLGEPKKYHPLVFFGNSASWIETNLNSQSVSALKQKLFGMIALVIMTSPFVCMIDFLSGWDTVNMLIAPIILYFCIAAKSLKQHVASIFLALEQNNLVLARQGVSMIVSRQTDKMNSDNIRKATIESVLENGADAIFAPIFWFILLGPAGAVLYRLSNTLDAMWGYKNQRYLHFGWAAAKFDDLLNWAPARLTALSYAVLGNTKLAIHCWMKQAHKLDSPNAGPVMTSGAGALNLKLGGPAWYHGALKNKAFFGTQKNPNNNDIYQACALISSTLYLWIIVLLVTTMMGGYFA